MCGILAVIIENKELDIDSIKSCQESLIKRGPDNQINEYNPKYVFKFSRLSINDTSDIANQPFKQNNIIMMCNGEIYNYKQLIKKYNLNCISKSDCEPIIHLYEKLGFLDTINLLDGVFAIILYDMNNNKCFYATDRIGIRPLFKGITKSGNIALSSVASGILDFCNNVERVKPGFGFFENKKCHHLKYKYNNYLIDKSTPLWNLNVPLNDYNDLFVTIRRYLTNAVKKRLLSDRPICCMLSGGLDSSLITSIMCKLIGPQNVHTFSIGMEGALDLKYAKKVADYLGTTHTEVFFTPEEGFSIIPQLIKDLECYDITTIRASVGMWLLSRYISKNTNFKVILSGEGSDELFGGYLYFHHAPSPEEFIVESKRLIDNLYLYDVLRADRSVSSHGLELRVPFLDKNFVNYILALEPKVKMVKNDMEKFVLRESFKNNYLPDEILWRRKDGFSDGCSNPKKSWYMYIQEFVEDIIPDQEFDKYISEFPSKEAYYYKKIYNQFFPTYQPIYDYWLPKWVKHNGDPSGRLINVFTK